MQGPVATTACHKVVLSIATLRSSQRHHVRLDKSFGLKCLFLLFCFQIELSTTLHSSPPAINADQEQSLTPTQSNVAHPLRERIAYSPMHPDQVRSPATKRTPPSIPGTSATTEEASPTALWDQVRAAALQWSALGIVEPKGESGQSVLMDWVERRPDAIFYCKVPTPNGRCRVYNSKKDRILSHIRKDHLNFRPFCCRGVCGTPHW